MGCTPSIIDDKKIIIPKKKYLLENKRKIYSLNEKNNTLIKKNKDLNKEISQLQIIMAKNSIYNYELEERYKFKIRKKNKINFNLWNKLIKYKNPNILESS